MKMMGKEFAVTMETDSGWMRSSLTDNGENAIYHQAPQWWQADSAGTHHSICGHGLCPPLSGSSQGHHDLAMCPPVHINI